MEIMDDILDLADWLGETAAKGKRILCRRRGQSGFSTITMVLIILMLGAVILTPLLYFVITGQRSAARHDRIS